MAKRPRIDSAAAAVDAARASQQQISPPSNVPLDARDLPFFASVLDEFARSEWTAHQLELAAMLARTMADLEEEQRLMRAEGSTLKTDKGTPVINPRKTAIQMHYGNIHSARRSLSLHARAQGGEARDVAKRRDMAREFDTGEGDDLLARPN
jgi:hypothetical protein